MNIEFSRPLKVYVDENTKKARVGISKKNVNGSYETAYLGIEFNKGVEVENEQLIKPKKIWLSFYKWTFEGKKGTTWFLKCSEFDLIESNNIQNEELEEADQESFSVKDLEFTEEDLGW